MLLQHFFHNTAQHISQSVHHIIILKTNDCVTPICQFLTARLIIALLFLMNSTIDFNDQFFSRTAKINKIHTDWMLPSEFESPHLLSA